MKSRLWLLKTSVLLASAALWIGAAAAAPLSVAVPPGIPSDASANDQPAAADPTELAPNLRRQLVDYPANVVLGTVIIDTAHTYLYYVLGEGKAIRYGIGVGRQGFTWSGTEKVTRKAEWPD
jgi:lipoprotein-anchoring transpeptidase ErfK/SrfK